MRILTIVILLLVSCVPLEAQNLVKKFRIDGYINGLQTPDGKMYLQGLVNGVSRNDTVEVRDGHFSFSGETEPVLARVYSLRVGHKGYVNPMYVFLDEGIIQVQAVYDTTEYTFLKDVKIKGSKVQDEYIRFNEALKLLFKDVDQVKLEADYKMAEGKKDTVALAAIMETYKSLNRKTIQFMAEYIRKNTNSFVSLHFVNERSRATGEQLDSAKTWFLGLDPALQFSITGRKIAENMAYASRGELIGKPAVDFEQLTPEGKKVKLSDYRGKYVLLDFWASWCGPCRAENPHVLKAYQQFKDKGFDVLAVSVDTDVNKWKKAILEDNLPWVHVSDLKRSNSAMQQFGVSGIPDNFLIDPDGVVIARGLRGDGLLKKLSEIFNKK